MKKTLALLLALVLCLGLLAGCQEDPVGTTTQPSSSADPNVTETTTEPPAYSFEGKSLDMVTQKDLTGYPIIDWVKEAIGLNLSAVEIPENFDALLTEKVTPSLVFGWGPSYSLRYGRYGAYINLYDYKDLLPNFFAKYESYGDMIKADYEPSPGELYSAPIFVNGDYQHYGWMYREDIFKELNLSVPTDWDSFLAVCKALKEKYPESFPFTARNLNNMNMTFFADFAQQFGVRYDNADPVLDEETNTWYNGMTTDEAREMLEKMRQLIELGYMDIGVLSNDTAKWQADFTSGRSFITYDKAFQLGALEGAGQEANANFSIAWWHNIPLSDAGAKFNYHCQNSKDYNYSLSIITRCPDVELAVRYLDWLYTDEATEIFSWGKEGVSYEVDADGNKRFIQGFDTSNMAIYYFLGSMDFKASIAVRTPKTQAMILDTMEAAKNGQMKALKPTFNDEEQQTLETYFTSWEAKQTEYIQKFLLGQIELNDDTWAQYKADLDALGNKEILDAYNSAAKRANG